MAKAVEQLEQVTIRFAGDSGDGMQLTGDRFTSETAIMGNDLVDPAGLPGRDSRAGRLASGRLRLPAPLRRSRHPHAGRPERARGDEPGGAEDEPRRPAEGRTLIVDRDRFKERNLTKASYETSPLVDELGSTFHLHEVALISSMTDRGAEGIKGVTRASRALEDLLRARADDSLYHPAHGGTLKFVERSSQAAGDRPGETRRR